MSLPRSKTHAEVAVQAAELERIYDEAQRLPTVEEWLSTREDEVRTLAAFVERMKAELASNSGKGDRAAWMRDTPRELLAEVQHHYVKLHACVVEYDRQLANDAARPLPWLDPAAGDWDSTSDGLEALIGEFAADVANMAMMVADRCGALRGADRTQSGRTADSDLNADGQEAAS